MQAIIDALGAPAVATLVTLQSVLWTGIAFAAYHRGRLRGARGAGHVTGIMIAQQEQINDLRLKLTAAHVLVQEYKRREAERKESSCH